METVEKGQAEASASRAGERVVERPLRLALLIGSLGPGGAEGVLARLATAWARRGDDVTLVTLAPASLDFFPVDPAVRRVALDLAGDSASPAAAVAANLRRLAALRRTLGARAPDLVLSFVDHTNVLALAACLGTRLPIVVCERTDPTRHVLREPWTLLRRLLYPRATALVVQHEGLRPWAEALCGPERVLVLPNPVAIDPPTGAHTEHPPPDLPSDVKHRVFGLGRLSPEKGFDRLVAAFARCADRLPGWALVLTGDGPERARLEAMVAASGLAGRVVLRGVSPEPWRDAREGDVFVLPSRYEGTSNALLEAMARGLAPVVTPEGGALHGLVRDGESALVAADGSAESLAAALVRVASDDALRARLASGARRSAARWAVDRVAAEWREALVGVLDRQRARTATPR